MRALVKPLQDFSDVFESCLLGVSDVALRGRYQGIIQELQDAAEDYELKAPSASLYLIAANNQANGEVVVGEVLKKELKSLYSTYLVTLGKPARPMYDRLIASAPGEKCPYCGVGRVSTLDHYLPKSKFPCLSILPANLVPSCADCNFGKRSSLALSLEDQPIHPYYDRGVYVSDQWLCGEVVKTSPPSVRYYVSPPEGWIEHDRVRVKSHLDAFNLAARYSVQAAEELTSIRQMLIDYVADGNPDSIRDHLLRNESVERKIHPNSWKTAMYQALAKSEWYLNGGYL